ncbi:hypothetical protein VP01_23g5 [Puccinia sorghi]|uniref:F-box domain-containing protein n=1 Tax=Puccinia sorghi TaxID=27349 RepID=A0A0L6V7G4_9BASI|nr:hypothetical protein VP01_23g5 [Puccinia sorghi]
MPSKKQLAALNHNHNPISQDQRPRKSFFSFKTSGKRSTSRAPPQDNHSAPIQFPTAVDPIESSTPPPFRIDLPIRNLRSSVLFSSQFDLNTLGNDDQLIHRDPTPTPLISDTPSRPIRPTTRPISWMRMIDGSYAHPAKAQQHQHSPESFYSRAPTSENRLESSDDDASHQVPAPTASGDREPITHQPHKQQQQQQQPLMLGCSLPASSPYSAAPAPGLQPPITILPQTRPPVSPRSVPPAPLSLQSSPYSPLAAFLGQADKPDVKLASKDKSNNDNTKSNSVLAIPNPTPKASPSSNSLLSAFFGSPPAPEKPSKLSTSTKPVVSEAPSSEGGFFNGPALPKKHGSATELRTPASERSLWNDAKVIEEMTSEHPKQSAVTLLTSSSSSIGKSPHDNKSSKPLLSTTTEKIEPIIASPKNAPLAPEPQAIPPSATLPPISSSPSRPTCHSPLPSTPRNSSIPGDSVLSHSSSNPPPVMQEGGGGTRKRSVENVYFDSSSQYTSSSSDNYSSVDEINTTEAEDRDRVTDPSSACSRSGSSPRGTPEKYKNCNSVLESPVSSQGESLKKSHVDDELGHEVQMEKDNCPAGTEDHMDQEEAEPQDQVPPRQQIKINFEQLLCHPDIFRNVISHLEYLDFFSLSQINREFHEELEDDALLREIIMTRYLSGFGYRSLPTYLKARQQTVRELVKIDLKDLASFYAGLEFESLELIGAHNKLVAYVRAVEELEPLPPNHYRNAHLRRAPRSHEPVFRSGKAALFKVWNVRGSYGGANSSLYSPP